MSLQEVLQTYKKAGCVEPTEDGTKIKEVLTKLNQIEEKNKCLRVQFLDWLSDKLVAWSKKCNLWANNIDSPCVIKVEPRNKGTK